MLELKVMVLELALKAQVAVEAALGVVPQVAAVLAGKSNFHSGTLAQGLERSLALALGK